MKPIPDTQSIALDTGALNEIVLHAAAEMDGETLAPEASIGNAGVTVWDESSDDAGQRMPKMPMENEETITEQLVNAGNEEADREQRVRYAERTAHSLSEAG